ncbi:MAG: hypothetical protein A2Z70_02040 [Chloroflexi bacterium RBG_13_48_17]|nr:MAG: hypothetical protein A2Z70_02040 [Chloroflexi bacterium RBG_13_48_17]
MNHTIEVRETYIYIRVSGQISLKSQFGWQEIKSALADAVDSVRKNNIFKLLVDCRDISGRFSIMDRFLLAAFFVKENSKFMATKLHPLRVTFVLNKSIIDPWKFGETVARNRGLFGLVTDDIQEALQWLDIDDSSK